MAEPPKKSVSPEETKTAEGGNKAKIASSKSRMDAVELIRLRNDFYRDNYRRLIVILLMLMVLMFSLLFWIYYLTTHRPQPRYFATNAIGGLAPLRALNQPSMSQGQMQNWAARAAAASFTFNFAQLNQQLAYAKETYFTDTGGAAFMKALTASKDLDAVVQGKFIVTSQPTGAPQILSQGVMQSGNYKGRYAWVVKVPLQISYESSAMNVASRRNVDVQMTIVRTSLLVDNAAPNVDGLQGIGVSQLLVKGAVAPDGVGGNPVRNQA